MIIALIFTLGTILGSFLNVCIHRLPKGQSVVLPGSHCPGCKKPIEWYDNIPLLSYILLRGKCRVCGWRIPARYFIVELFTALLLTALYLVFGITVQFFAYGVMTALLLIATFVDFEIQEIPDEVSLGGIAAGVVLSTIFPVLMEVRGPWHGLIFSIMGAFAGGASIYAMGFIGELIFKKEAMGGGDVKLMAMIGSFLGWKLVLLTFFIAPIFGAGVGIIKKLKDGSQTIAYGPYLSMAALVALLWGERIIALFAYGLY